MNIYIYIRILCQILFHYSSLQGIEHSSLCYTVGLCCSPIFKNNFTYLFGCAESSFLQEGFSLVVASGVLLCSWDARTFHCSGLSCCGTRALGRIGLAVAARRLQSSGSVVAANGLSCPLACGLFPNQGWNLCSRNWQVLPTGPSGKPCLPIWYVVECIC